jgi:hypothetical protein
MNKSRKFAALILITVILSAFSFTVRAQDEEDGDEPHGLYLPEKRVFYGGLIVGANFAQVDGDYFAGYDKIGLNAGGIAYAQLAKHVALSLEILYSQKGSKSNQGGEPSPNNTAIYIYKYGINVNYAEIPVMINYFDKRRSHFGIGVSYARLVNSSESIQVDSSGIAKTLNFNINYPFKKDAFDFLAGVELHLVKGLFMNIRFQYSMIPIRTQLPPPDYARANQYSNLWTVRLMYLLK